MQNSKLMVFKNDMFWDIRTMEINGDPWFVGKDVADALGYSNTRDALARHVDDEDKNTVVNPDGNRGNPNMTIINESGLYSLVLSSKLPGAKQFKRWVTSDIIPSIRKHGAYMTQSVIEQVISDPGAFLRLVEELRNEQEKSRALESELDISKEWYSIKRVAAINGCSWKCYDWRKLKKAGVELGYDVKKIFDANYGEVNTYHADVWQAVYPHAEL